MARLAVCVCLALLSHSGFEQQEVPHVHSLTSASRDWLQILTVWSAEPAPERGEAETCSLVKSMLFCTLTVSLSYMSAFLSTENSKRGKKQNKSCIILSCSLLKSHESVVGLWWEQSSLVAHLKDGDMGDVWHLLVFLSVCYAAVWP